MRIRHFVPTTTILQDGPLGITSKGNGVSPLASQRGPEGDLPSFRDSPGFSP